MTIEIGASSEQRVISILDIEGALIYSNNVGSEDAYSKQFNLSNLSNGEYVLRIEDALKITTFKFDIDNSIDGDACDMACGGCCIHHAMDATNNVKEIDSLSRKYIYSMKVPLAKVIYIKQIGL